MSVMNPSHAVTATLEITVTRADGTVEETIVVEAEVMPQEED